MVRTNYHELGVNKDTSVVRALTVSAKHGLEELPRAAHKDLVNLGGAVVEGVAKGLEATGAVDKKKTEAWIDARYAVHGLKRQDNGIRNNVAGAAKVVGRKVEEASLVQLELNIRAGVAAHIIDPAAGKKAIDEAYKAAGLTRKDNEVREAGKKVVQFAVDVEKIKTGTEAGAAIMLVRELRARGKLSAATAAAWEKKIGEASKLDPKEAIKIAEKSRQTAADAVVFVAGVTLETLSPIEDLLGQSEAERTEFYDLLQHDLHEKYGASTSRTNEVTDFAEQHLLPALDMVAYAAIDTALRGLDVPPPVAAAIAGGLVQAANSLGNNENLSDTLWDVSVAAGENALASVAVGKFAKTLNASVLAKTLQALPPALQAAYGAGDKTVVEMVDRGVQKATQSFAQSILNNVVDQSTRLPIRLTERIIENSHVGPDGKIAIDPKWKQQAVREFGQAAVNVAVGQVMHLAAKGLPLDRIKAKLITNERVSPRPGAGAPNKTNVESLNPERAGKAPKSGEKIPGPKADATADAAPQSKPKMVRPQSVVVLSPDLEGIAAKLLVPEHLQDATIILGHGNPERLAGMDREKAVAFASARAEPGKPIVFVSCALAAEVKPGPIDGTPRPGIPASVAGTGKFPYVVAYRQTVTVLPYDAAGFANGAIVPIRERPDISPVIQQGPSPENVPAGKVVRRIGNDQYVICDDNIIPVQKPIKPEDQGGPGIGKNKDGVYVKVVMHEVVPTERARRVYLPVIGNWATDQANVAHHEAMMAATRGHDHPQAAGFYKALGDFYKAKARWYEASRDNPANANLEDVKQAHAKLISQYSDLPLATMRSKDPLVAAELDNMRKVTSESAEWLKEAEAPGSILSQPRSTNGSALVVAEVTDPVLAASRRGLGNQISPSKVDNFASVRDQFSGGVAPQIVNRKLAEGTHKLSIPKVGGIIFSEKTNTPIAVSQHISPERIRAADQVARSKTKFQDDSALPEGSQAVGAYAGFTDRFDRGHMIAAGESPSQGLNAETFRNSNIVPQEIWHNERLWDGIQLAVRTMARNGDDLYVVTGPSFIGPTIESISDDAGRQVLVPTHIWKAVYDKTVGQAAVYWTENKRGSERNQFRDSYQVISIAEFTKRTGIDPFPNLSFKQKHQPMRLPPPEAPRYQQRGSKRQESELTSVSNPVAGENAQRLEGTEAPGGRPPQARAPIDRASGAAGKAEPVVGGSRRTEGNEISPSKVDDFASVHDQFVEGVAPQILNSRLAEGTHKLSIPKVGGIIYSEKTNTPIAVSQHLTPERINAADRVVRSKTIFQDDPALPESSHSVAAYGGFSDRFDRGHMIPIGESESQALNNETYRNSNMVPQDIWHNERLWNGIESAVRTMVRNGEDLYVVTGPAFIGKKIDSISDDAGRRVLVPSHIWKAVYDKTSGKAAVYWTENKRGSEANQFSDSYRVLSIAEFRERTGIDPFPNLSADQQQHPMELPAPETPRYEERSHDPQSELTSVANPVASEHARRSGEAEPPAEPSGHTDEPEDIAEALQVDEPEHVTKIHASELDNFASVEDQFLDGVAPKVVDHKLAQGTYKLSVPGVGGIIFSRKSNTPIAAAEHLDAERVNAADQVTRSKAKFRDDLSLPESAHTVAAYAGYTDRFDHGHMIPAGDSSSQALNTATFRSSNIVPQDAWHNERLWEGIESGVRAMARNGDDLYVVTGPAFIGQTIESISDDAGHQVLVPTNIWKAVYDKTSGQAGVYWTENAKGSEADDFRDSYQVLSIAEFTKRTGIDPFPNLSEDQKQNAMELPPPETPRFHERKHDPQSELTDIDNPIR